MLHTEKGGKTFTLFLVPAKGVSHVELALSLEDAQGSTVIEPVSVTWRAKPSWTTRQVLTSVVVGALTLAAVGGLVYHFNGSGAASAGNSDKIRLHELPNDQHSQDTHSNQAGPKAVLVCQDTSLTQHSPSLGNAVIGKAEWERYFGNVGSKPALPDYRRDYASSLSLLGREAC